MTANWIALKIEVYMYVFAETAWIIISIGHRAS